MAKATAAAKPAAPTHSKEQLLRSQRYAKRFWVHFWKTVSGIPSKRLIPLSKTL